LLSFFFARLAPITKALPFYWEQGCCGPKP